MVAVSGVVTSGGAKCWAGCGGGFDQGSMQRKENE